MEQMWTLQQTKSHPAPSGPKLSSRTTHTRTASSSSVCSAAFSLPPSALRKGKYDTSCNVSSNQPTPIIDLSIVHETYGENATLYNVLSVKPSADSDAIRQAYLRQGRKTLMEHGIARKNDRGKYSFVTPEAAPKKLEDVPEKSRKQFQAISMAYEILSTPDLRRAYDANKLAKRPTAIDAKRANNVRWNPYVEEKIIEDSHPDEHSHRKKNEDGWLHQHLLRLDQEAEMFLNSDFIDEIDGSIQSMSESLQESIGSLLRRGMGQEVDSKEEKPPQASALKGKLQMIRGKVPQKSCLRKGKISKMKSLFSEEIKDDAYSPPSSPSDKNHAASTIESPCSVANVGLFVSEVVDETVSMFAESFSGLLDGPKEKQLQNGNKQPARTTPSLHEIRAMELNALNQQLLEGFGEPFYSPSSSKK